MRLAPSLLRVECGTYKLPCGDYLYLYYDHHLAWACPEVLPLTVLVKLSGAGHRAALATWLFR